jgi:ribosomal protein S27E/RNase P protein component
MPRPRNASYRSHHLIYEALSSGPKYLEELENTTGLHRNTLTSRLNFLESEGLIRKRRENHRVYNEIIQPLRNEHGTLRIEGLKWMNYLVGRRTIMQQRNLLRRILREQISDRKKLAATYRFIESWSEDFDELVESSESQEILRVISNWQDVPIPRIWLILELNKYVLYLNSQKRICPDCHSTRTVPDVERNEVVCGNCGLVIEDTIIGSEERLEIILTMLNDTTRSR